MCVSTKSNTQKLHKPRFLYISVMRGVSVGRSTINDILRDKVKWLSVSKECGPRE